MFSNLSLKYRIAIIIFFLEAIMMASVLQLTLGQSFEATTKQINTNEFAILELVNGMSKTALITEEYSDLQPYIINLVANTEITKLFLTDANKIVIISSSVKHIGNYLPELKQNKNNSWKTVEITNASGLLGVLAVEFSNQELVSAYRDAREFGISIALFGMLVIAVIGVLVGFLLTRRLESITATAKCLADGDYSAKTQIHGNDEIGKLAVAFDKMVENLLTSSTELSHTLDSLQQKEKNLSVTLQSIGDAVITTDTEGNVARMNPVAENLTGWPFSEAKGKSLNTVFPIINATTREPIENPVEKVITTGAIVHLSNHTTLISRNGDEHQIADSAAPIIDNNIILGMVLVFNDITEQYQLREARQESEERFRQLAENINEVFWLGSPDWHEIFYISPAYEKIWGYKANDLYKNPRIWLEAVFPDDREQVIEDIPENINSIVGCVDFREYRVQRPDGQIIWIKARAYPIKDESGQIVRIAGIAEDITERIHMEETLRRSQKMDALGKLTGGVAHDYNNMLGIILGYSELLKEQLKDQPNLEMYIDQIHHAGERGAKLTKKLLTFSRSQSVENQTINVNTVLQNSRLMLEKTMTARISLEFDLSEDLWMVHLDLSDLEDAILNICINAMHAIEEHGKIIFKTSNQIISNADAHHLDVAEGEYVMLSITDTGCGMDKATKERIFDPFFSTKGELGTGLGLSQVYGLVERSNGRIKIYSEPGHGTRFAIYFPRFYEEKADLQDTNTDKLENPKGSETILVVDDEPALAELAAHVLNESGYEAFVAHSGEEALSLLENKVVDVLISDVVMPEVDGFQLAEIVKEKFPAIKIQLVSGYSDDRHVDTEDDSLHKNILHKPYHSKVLLQRIRELIDNK